jgi:Sec-independent protein translocase protein TatA
LNSNRANYFASLATLAVGVFSLIALIWLGIDHVLTWKVIGTAGTVLAAYWVVVAATSGSTERLGWLRTEQPAERVTYVFDAGLVRFLKFAGAILAIFLVVGAFLFGVDLKKATELVQTAETETKKAQQAVKDVELAMRERQEQARKESAEEATKLKNLDTAAGDSAKNAEAAAKKIESLVSKAQGDVRQIELGVTKLGTAPPPSPPLRPEEIEHLTEVKILRSFRHVLPGDQFAKLKEELRPTANTVRREIYDAGNGTSLPGKLVRSEGQAQTGDPVATQTYDSLGIIYEFYSEVFSRNSIDDLGMTVVATIHYGKGFDNCFWDGRRLVLGDGDGKLFRINGFSSLSVLARESSHGVIQSSGSLAYHDQSGALVDHFADVFAALAEQWHKKQTVEQASWLIGSDIFAQGVKGSALRSMKAPGTAYDDPALGGKDPQPGHMKDYVKTTNDLGGVHINSGIPNRAFYEVAKAMGGKAWEKPGQIWYTTLSRLQPQSSFQDCAQMTYDVAREKYKKPEMDAVKNGWEAVGISVKTQ